MAMGLSEHEEAAFAAIIVFLGLNEIDFDVPPAQATAMILSLAAGEVSEESLTRWISDKLAQGSSP